MTVTPDFWPDLLAFAGVVTPALLILGAIRAVALWREHHTSHDKETDQ